MTETLFAVGNGYLGLRGNQPEGRHALEHGTFINGFHETFPIRHAEQAYGFAEVGQTIINAPDAKVMRVYVDDEPLSFDFADVREYERSLDMRDGVLRRHLIWVTPSGKEVRIDFERMVSFEEKHLAIMRVDVTVLNADAPVTVSCQMINRQDGEDVYGGSPVGRQEAGIRPPQGGAHPPARAAAAGVLAGRRSLRAVVSGDRIGDDHRPGRRPRHRDRERVLGPRARSKRTSPRTCSACRPRRVCRSGSRSS